MTKISKKLHIKKFTYFQKLKTSVFLNLIKKQVEEPEQEAIDGLTDETAKRSRANKYINDIERIKKEFCLSISLLKKIPGDKFLKEHNTTAEDYIMYHQGCVLNLVHQSKDKIKNLIDALTTDSKYKDRDISILNLAKEEKITNIKNLPKLLKEWDQNSKSGIGVALRKRTHYQHFRNKLTLNKGFLNIKIYRTLQQKSLQDTLTKEGKKMVIEKSTQAITNWHKDINKKIKGTIDLVNANIENISKILYSQFPLPNVEKEGSKIISKYQKMLDALQIKNVSKKENISAAFYPITKTLETVIPTILADNLVSFYITGSVVRGDAEYGLSDINIVIVLNKTDSTIVNKINSSIENIKNESGVRTEIIPLIISVDEFTNKNNARTRFICKTDGLLIYGKDIIGNEKYPKPGLKLALFLNDNFRDKINSIKSHLEKNLDINQETVNKFAKIVSKSILRLSFAEVMSNKAIYEKNFYKMIEMAKKEHPSNTELLDKLYKIAKGEALVKKDSLMNMLVGAEEGFYSLLEQIEKKNQELENRKVYT